MPGMSPIPPELEDPLREALQRQSPRDRALVTVGLNLGLRANELAHLLVRDVAAPEGIRTHLILHRSRLKNGRGLRKRSVRGRILPINAQARAALTEYLFSRYGATIPLSNSYLFPSRKRQGALGRGQISRIVKTVVAEAGDTRSWRYASHSLRKAFASNLYALTRDLLLVRDALGHRSIATTEIYVAKDSARLEQAVLALGRGATNLQAGDSASRLANRGESSLSFPR